MPAPVSNAAPDQPSPLDRTFAALADPTRRAIVERLVAGEASFTELADPFPISRPAVVKHIRALEAAGLVSRSGPKARPIYRLEPGPLKTSVTWIELQRRLWQESLDGLARYAERLANAGGGKA